MCAFCRSIDARRTYRGRLFVWRDISAERRFRAELQRNNERLLAVQQELIAARDAAEAGNRAKSAFLAHMSHEIRTPLTAIAGYCHLLETGIERQSLAQTRADLEAIRVATGHLLDLANNVLEMAQIESGQTTLHEVAFDVAEIVHDVTATVRPLLRRNRNRLTMVGTDAVGVVQGDAAKVRQVLLNLVSNAAKFTTDGEVEVGVVCEVAEEIGCGCGCGCAIRVRGSRRSGWRRCSSPLRLRRRILDASSAERG
jgi:signal transduction histidine kinase